MHLYKIFIVLLFAVCAQMGANESLISTVYNHHDNVSEHVWSDILPYLLPEESRIRVKLDKIFLKERVLKNEESLKKGGFIIVQKQQWSRLYIARHKSCPGYIFKIYLDCQRYHQGLPEHYFWIKRCFGSRLVAQEIEDNQWNDWFKVPKKWIYPLPPEPLASAKHVAKFFILVEEDMDLYSPGRSSHLWRSQLITKPKLDALYHIIQKHGLWDCAKPDNIPIAKDHRIAFVDTQTWHRWPVAFENLNDSLRPSILNYWKSLWKPIN